MESWTWLCFSGCLSLSGPRRVMGIVGGSLRVECRYREEFINNTKYWCKHPCVLLWRMVETTESEREVRRGRLSIRDHPASLTFTVTLENLREEDGGLYRCGIDVLSTFDPIFNVEVSVIPGEHLPPSLQSQAGHPDPQEGNRTERLGQDDGEGVGGGPGYGCCLGPTFVCTHAHLCL